MVQSVCEANYIADFLPIAVCQDRNKRVHRWYLELIEECLRADVKEGNGEKARERGRGREGGREGERE